ncbi:bifunctional precorrin-2 dehydrogenase/sirohydrochlorin ferrochelatase [Croceicoccus sp. YJ47]|uniref:precorrin-2 dehydrogenase/sirohydrochlorin ferrochelatase family protein n=1 Tax=Croceicoccus sp. YJ47 TaxID=2798724 RepID=UPI001923A780|nr:NAD(P)-dependent oxidoreductase [Croceicoccus sp. YJ47]QQN74553.1 siroheme synthase [Croceicoccus sp. YJ47]
MQSLPLFHRVAGQKIVVLGEGEAAAAKRRLIERAGGICVGEPEAHHARLAFIAIDDAREGEAAAIRMRCRGLLVNVTDRTALCEFTVPSILDRDPVLVAVGTGGASAGLAKMLRLRLERLLPPGLGRLAQALGMAREAIRARYPQGADRRRALDIALGEGGALDPLTEHGAGVVDDWLVSDADTMREGRYAIALRSADPDDLTLREARLLGSADYVVHAPGVPAAILNRARADAVRVPVAESDTTGDGVIVAIHGP